MAIEFRCDQCGKLLRTADEKAGLEAKCPGCGAPVVVPHSVDDWQEDDFDDFDQDEFDLEDEEFASPPPGWLKTCPMCGEQVKASAFRCRYCGEEFDEDRPYSARTPKRETSGMAGAALGTGIASIVFSVCCGCFSIPLGISSVTLGFMALNEIKQGRADGKGMAVAGIICGGLSLLVIVMLVILQFAIGMNGPQFPQFQP